VKHASWKRKSGFGNDADFGTERKNISHLEREGRKKKKVWEKENLAQSKPRTRKNVRKSTPEQK